MTKIEPGVFQVELLFGFMEEPDVPTALTTWERNERPVTEHAQRISYLLGVPTTWPPALRALALGVAGRSKWLVRQRTKTALHRPTGTPP